MKVKLIPFVIWDVNVVIDLLAVSHLDDILKLKAIMLLKENMKMETNQSYSYL